jgi:hypothetical protein
MPAPMQARIEGPGGDFEGGIAEGNTRVTNSKTLILL